MGNIKQILAQSELNDRDKHNGRVFVDRSENVHVHYREFRFVFSVDEFFYFANAVIQGKENLRLAVMAGYKESPDNKTVIIGGSQGSDIPLNKSTESAYFNNRFVIEEQANKDIDKFHIHIGTSD